jgi:uncharacterized protein (DUF4415 family)
MQGEQMKRQKRLRRRGKIRRLTASAGAGGRDAGKFLRWYRPVKQKVSLRLDADLLAWLKRRGPSYQTRINRILRKAMREEVDGVEE